jgi:hypothetical protein
MAEWLMDLSPDVVLLALVGLAAVVVITLVGRRLSVTVGNVHAELTPNGGSSVRDAIDRIEAEVTRHGERLDKLEQTPSVATAIVVTPSPQEPG